MGEQKQLAFGLNSHVLSFVLSKVIWADEHVWLPEVVWVLQHANSLNGQFPVRRAFKIMFCIVSHITLCVSISMFFEKTLILFASKWLETMCYSLLSIVFSYAQCFSHPSVSSSRGVTKRGRNSSSGESCQELRRSGFNQLKWSME